MGENGGNIVNIVLISGMGMAGQSHSAAAREGVKNMSMCLGAEWADKDWD
jgi:NAD(P)-dependent dehydrogenase (short-subunit alcohol dehydrogenase family)